MTTPPAAQVPEPPLPELPESTKVLDRDFRDVEVMWSKEHFHDGANYGASASDVARLSLRYEASLRAVEAERDAAEDVATKMENGLLKAGRRIAEVDGELLLAKDAIADAEAATANLEAQLAAERDRLRLALEAIASPIVYLQKEAKKAGGSLDGVIAAQLSNDSGWLKGIATAALTAAASPGQV